MPYSSIAYGLTIIFLKKQLKNHFFLSIVDFTPEFIRKNVIHQEIINKPGQFEVAEHDYGDKIAENTTL